jgi:hypothetical protein
MRPNTPIAGNLHFYYEGAGIFNFTLFTARSKQRSKGKAEKFRQEMNHGQ